MTACRTLLILGLGLWTATLAAQEPPAPEGAPRPPERDIAGAPQGTTGRTTLQAHTEQGSRKLFAACDGDSDDRLDLFEASEALETLGDPVDARGFRALDRDRDGYIGWSEFDAHFRSVVDRGIPFQVRTCRRFVQSAPELQQAKVATPLDMFMQLHDANENGGLDPEEIEKIVEEMGLLPIFREQLKALDRDQSGCIEGLELEPFFDKLLPKLEIPGLAQAPEAAATSSLPAPWGRIDGDGNSAIDLVELEAALRRLDPALARWARHLLTRHDRNQDGRLTVDELPRPAPRSEPSGASGEPALLGRQAAPPAPRRHGLALLGRR